MGLPERLGLELVRDAEAVNPGCYTLNYVRLVSAEGNTVVLMDEVGGEQFTVQPSVLVNAGGAWIDQINQVSGQQTTLIGGTKGSHLVLDCPRLRQAISEHEIF